MWVYNKSSFFFTIFFRGRRKMRIHSQFSSSKTLNFKRQTSYCLKSKKKDCPNSTYYFVNTVCSALYTVKAALNYNTAPHGITFGGQKYWHFAKNWLDYHNGYHIIWLVFGSETKVNIENNLSNNNIKQLMDYF